MPFTLFYFGIVVLVAFFGTIKDNKAEKLKNQIEVSDSLRVDSIKMVKYK